MQLKKTSRAVWQSISPADAVAIKHLRSEGTDDEALIKLNLAAAEEDIENELGFPIVDCRLTGFQSGFSAISLPSLPTYRADTVAVKYFDETDTLTTLPAEKYRVYDDGVWVRIVFAGDLPAVSSREDAVMVTIDAGFANVYEVTPLYKQAILTRAGSKYADREEVSERYKKASDAMIGRIRNRNA